jgi:hypothetical protein
LHESVVHTSLSAQSSGGPPTHELPEHWSLVVQTSPSLQGRLFGGFEQLPAVHVSLVQRLPSLQSFGVPWHAPAVHVSFSVHALPSVHGPEIGGFEQPVAGMHPSLVQGFPSSQLRGPPGTQAPPLHTSPTVH